MQEKKEKFDKLKYNEIYNKKNYKRYELKINVNTQKNIIDVLDSVKNRTAYICDLIEKDIEKNK